MQTDIIDLVNTVEQKGLQFLTTFNKLLESKHLSRLYMDNTSYITTMMDEVYDGLMPIDETYTMSSYVNVDLSDFEDIIKIDIDSMRVLIEYLIFEESILHTNISNININLNELLGCLTIKEIISSRDLITLAQLANNDSLVFNMLMIDIVTRINEETINIDKESRYKVLGWCGGSMVLCFLKVNVEHVEGNEYENRDR